MQYVTFYNENEMPAIGFGTWHLKGDEARQATLHALKTGYRLIDTAAIYGNEKAVGAAVLESGIEREDIFITTKLWSDDLGYESALEAFDRSLKALDLEYIDLYLIHWPANIKRLDAWRAMHELELEGKAKNIGVSNFTVEHLKELQEKTNIKPAVNQVEFHPHIYSEQKELLRYCDDNGIIVEAYSPLAQGDLIDHPVVREVAELVGVTTGQVLIRWAIEHETVPIPKSANSERIEENYDVFNFELSSQDMEKLDSISSGERVTHDPAIHQ